MSTNSNGDSVGGKMALRFGELVRVSTERQEKQGESLRTQRAQNQENVSLLGGTIVERYGGQEHATEGWEKKEMLRLAADAGKGKFDAVIVAHADRWDRGGEEAKRALEAFKKHGVRFFISVTEYVLHNPEHVLFLDLSSAIGKFQANNTKKKSILNRVARARRGVPTGGNLPFGRSYDRDTSRWGVDPARQALIADVAARYLAGERLQRLAKEYGVNPGHLGEVLRTQCGDSWQLDFRADDLNIHETVAFTVPRLLPEETIRAVCHRLAAKRTYLHGQAKHPYLLVGRVFCAACGYSFFGQANRGGALYYRHSKAEGATDCPVRPRPWVRADVIEPAVVGSLFDMLGNPAAILRAVRAAVPDCDEALGQRRRLEGEVEKVCRARERVLGLVARDALTDEQAEKQLLELKEREAGLRSELDRLAATLAAVPDAEAVRLFVERLPADPENGMGPQITVMDSECNTYVGGNDVWTFVTMTGDDRRRLVETALSGNLPDGTPAGVYVSQAGECRPHRPKQWTFTVRGRLYGGEDNRFGQLVGQTARPGPGGSRFGNAQVSADLAGQGVRDLGMSGDSGPSIVGRVAPPGMAPALADQHAAVLPEMANQVVPLHEPRLTSSYAPAAAARASARFISSASCSASRRLSSNSSRVRPCELTPGTSPTQPIHQSPCCWMTAV
jgi:DNA invertase Pin-like site-specific DNA recombinase